MRSCGSIPGEVVVDLRQQALGQEEVFGEGDLDVARVGGNGSTEPSLGVAAKVAVVRPHRAESRSLVFMR